MKTLLLILAAALPIFAAENGSVLVYNGVADSALATNAFKVTGETNASLKGALSAHEVVSTNGFRSIGTGTANTLLLSDGASKGFRVTPQPMSTNYNQIPDVAPFNGLLYETVTGETNATQTHVTAGLGISLSSTGISNNITAGANITIEASGDALVIAAPTATGLADPEDYKSAWIIGSGTTPLALGDQHSESLSGAAGANVNASATQGGGRRWTTVATTSNNPLIQGNLIWRTGRHITAKARFAIGENSNERVWFVMTDQTGNTHSTADNPAGNYAGFLYSSGVTNFWQTVTKDNTTQTAKTSAVAVDTSPHWFRIVFDDDSSQILFYIDGVLVGTHTSGQNLPSSGTNLRYALTLCTTEDVAKTLTYEQLYFKADF